MHNHGTEKYRFSRLFVRDKQIEMLFQFGFVCCYSVDTTQHNDIDYIL